MKPANWDDLRTILSLVRHGSLSKAAADLQVNYTTVARRVDRAEKALGLVLFEKLADGYRPTDDARLIATHAAAMEDQDTAMLRALQGRDTRLSGPLVVTAPQLVIAYAIAPALAEFVGAHPEVDLIVRATNDMLDLTRREADLAVRVSQSPGDTLKGQRLAEQKTASFAHTDWAARIAEDRTRAIDWIAYADPGTLPAGVADRFPGSRVRYRFDDMIAIAGAVQAGLGVARMPIFLGRALEGVVQVPCLSPRPYSDIWVVGHPDVWAQAKAAAFRAVLVRWFKVNQQRFVA